ncbi:MAG: hypothetical protein FD126_3471, partial [Elusimicrobia bacterium]
SGFEAADTAYTVSYSRKLTGSLASSLGGNLKLLRSQIGPYSAQTVAVDLGAQHRFAGKPLSLGASVLNIGRGLKFMDQSDPLPLTFSLGAAYRMWASEPSTPSCPASRSAWGMPRNTPGAARAAEGPWARSAGWAPAWESPGGATALTTPLRRSGRLETSNASALALDFDMVGARF